MSRSFCAGCPIDDKAIAAMAGMSVARAMELLADLEAKKH